MSATGALAGTTVAQKTSASKQQDRFVLANEHVKELLLLMDTDKNGKISKQEWMNFMEAEFNRLDKEGKGELDLKVLLESRLSVRHVRVEHAGKSCLLSSGKTQVSFRQSTLRANIRDVSRPRYPGSALLQVETLRFLLFDHDPEYGLEVPAAIRSLQITCVRTAPKKRAHVNRMSHKSLSAGRDNCPVCGNEPD
jgi:hypothetical protein